MTQFWTLLRGWADTRPGGMNDSQIARALGYRTQRVAKWKKGSLPDGAVLRHVSEVTGIAYDRWLDAVMVDRGYLVREEVGRDDGDATSMNAG